MRLAIQNLLKAPLITGTAFLQEPIGLAATAGPVAEAGEGMQDKAKVYRLERHKQRRKLRNKPLLAEGQGTRSKVRASKVGAYHTIALGDVIGKALGSNTRVFSLINAVVEDCYKFSSHCRNKSLFSLLS